jgi:hypothetical protein
MDIFLYPIYHSIDSFITFFPRSIKSASLLHALEIITRLDQLLNCIEICLGGNIKLFGYLLFSHILLEGILSRRARYKAILSITIQKNNPTSREYVE